MNKKKIKQKNKKPSPSSNGHYSTAGYPSPLTASFTELRNRAMKAPMLFPDFKETDVNIERHSKVVNYSSNFILATIVLCVLRDKKFYWWIQSCFVSKASTKQVSRQLLTTKEKEALETAKNEALGDAGFLLNSEVKTEHTKNAYVWLIPFSESDYLKLSQDFRNLTN